MTPTYVAELDFTIQKTSVKVQKINGLLLETYGMVLARFPIQNCQNKARFFEKDFLLANTSIKMILKIFFLVFSNADF